MKNEAKQSICLQTGQMNHKNCALPEQFRQQNRISKRQFQRMMMIELFSTTSLILPAFVVRLSGKNGLVPLLLGSALALLLAVYYLWVSEDWKEGYGQEIADRGTKVFCSIYMLLYGVRFFLHSVFLMILFSALIQEVLLPKQSRGLILLPILLLSFYGTGKSLSVRARTLEMLFYYIFVPLLLVLFLALFQVDYSSLPLMLWGEKGTIQQNAAASYGILLTYRAMEFALFLVPVTEKGGMGDVAAKENRVCDIAAKGNRECDTAAKEIGASAFKRRKGKTGMGMVCLFVIFLNLFIYIITVGMFGTIRTGEKLWSALYIMQNVRLPGHFLERLDILFLAFWIFSVFALFSGYLFYSEKVVRRWKEKCWTKRQRAGGWTESGGAKNRQKLWYPALFLTGVFVLTVLAPEPEKVLPPFASYVMWIDFPLSIVLPLIIKLKNPEDRKKIKKMGTLVLFLGMTGFLFTGCQSRVDIEDRNYILVLGLDKGADSKLLVTYGEADMGTPSGDGQGGGGQKEKTVSYEAESLGAAEKEDRKSDEKRLDYGHLKAILFSKELTEDRQSWEKVKKELENKSELAGTVFVFRVDGSAKECMELKEKEDSSLGDYLDKMMTNHKGDGKKGYTLGELLRDEAEGQKDRNFPVLKVEKEKIILRNDKVSSNEK